MDEAETRVVHLLLCLSRDTATVRVQRGEQGALLAGESDGGGWKKVAVSASGMLSFFL